MARTRAAGPAAQRRDRHGARLPCLAGLPPDHRQAWLGRAHPAAVSVTRVGEQRAMSAAKAPGPSLHRRKGFVGAVAGAASLAMLGLSFAAVPLYRLFCAATGFAGTPRAAPAAPLARGERTLTVRFDANVAPGLAWKFAPETAEIKLRTGVTATVHYKATNMPDPQTRARA